MIERKQELGKCVYKKSSKELGNCACKKIATQ